MKSVKVIIPEQIMVNKYLMGYPATKHNNNTIQNNIAAVEKFAGRISDRIINTGNHNDSKLCLKPIFKFFILAKYLEVYIIKTTPANVDGWNEKPTIGIFIHLLVLVNESPGLGWNNVYNNINTTTGIIKIEIPLK